MRILRRADVQQMTGLSRSTIYRWSSNGSFPKPSKLGPRAVGWPEAKIRAWIADRTGEVSSDA